MWRKTSPHKPAWAEEVQTPPLPLDFMFDTRLTDEQLCSIGVALGADVPFCITGGTRLCQGVGEIMSNLPSPDCAFVIIKPDVGISTPEAFKTL